MRKIRTVYTNDEIIVYGVEINIRKENGAILGVNKKVFSLLIAGVLTVGLLLGCSSNSEEKQTDNIIETKESVDED